MNIIITGLGSGRDGGSSPGKIRQTSAGNIITLSDNVQERFDLVRRCRCGPAAGGSGHLLTHERKDTTGRWSCRAHWEELTRQVTIVSGAIDARHVCARPRGCRKPSQCHPSGPGLGEIKNELWQIGKRAATPRSWRSPAPCWIRWRGRSWRRRTPPSASSSPRPCPASRPRAGWAAIFTSMAARSRRWRLSMCCSAWR